MTTTVRARAPLRLGLAGGGTDVSPFCDLHGGYVLNATIDRYAYAVIKTLDEPIVRFCATDQNRNCELPLAAHYPLNGELDLHRAVYNTTNTTAASRSPWNSRPFATRPPGPDWGPPQQWWW